MSLGSSISAHLRALLVVIAVTALLIVGSPALAQDPENTPAPAVETPTAATESQAPEPGATDTQPATPAPLPTPAATESRPILDPHYGYSYVEGEWVPTPAQPEGIGVPMTEAPAERRSRVARSASPFDVAANPALPRHCGLKMALVFDMSASVGATGVTESKNAALAVLDELAGTPTEIGIFSFASAAPATNNSNLFATSVVDPQGVSTVRAAISSLRLPGIYGHGATNWEAGLLQVLEDPTTYDVVYFITDGVPTTNNAHTTGEIGSVPHYSDVADAVTAANRVKATGARIVPLGVGMPGGNVEVLRDTAGYQNNGGYWSGAQHFPLDSGFWNTGAGYLNPYAETALAHHGQSQFYLQAVDRWSSSTSLMSVISGEGDYISVSNYNALAQQLREAATLPCEGSVTMRKEVVDADGNVVATSGDAVSGWEFTVDDVGTGLIVEEPAVQKTNAEGEAQFEYRTVTPDSYASVRLSEGERDNYVIAQQDGKNAKCRRQDGTEVEVTNDGDFSFRMTAGAGDHITCVVHNLPPTFSVDKTPAADQMPETTGVQPRTVIAPDGTFTVHYDITVRNHSTRALQLEHPIIDELTWPAGIAISGITVTVGNGARRDITHVNGRFELTPAIVGEIPAKGDVTIAVAVTGQASPAVMDALADTTYERCADANPTTATHPVSLFNLVTLEGDFDGTENNQACVDPVVPEIEAEKGPRPGEAMQVNTDGTAELVYTITLRNKDPHHAAASGRITDRILLPDFVTATGEAAITAEGDGSFTELVDKLEQAELVRDRELTLADAVELPAGKSATLTITIPVTVSAEATEEQWAELSECRREGATFAGGVHNALVVVRDTSQDDDLACIPLLPPDPAPLQIAKVVYDSAGSGDPLTAVEGAEFAIFTYDKDAANGIGPDREVTWSPVDGKPGVVATTLPAGRYVLVETRAPAGYSLLARPVHFEIAGDPEGDGSTYTIRLMNPVDDEPVVTTSLVDNTLLIQVADVTIGELPKTGGRGVIPALLGGVMILAAGAALSRRTAP